MAVGDLMFLHLFKPSFVSQSGAVQSLLVVMRPFALALARHITSAHSATTYNNLRPTVLLC